MSWASSQIGALNMGSENGGDKARDTAAYRKSLATMSFHAASG
jgi:hypothetical protein